MEIRKLELITGISEKIFYVWFFSTDSPIKRKECKADWQWILNFINHCQSTLHSLLSIGESVGEKQISLNQTNLCIAIPVKKYYV